MTKTTVTDAHEFVKNIIGSCENEFHFESAGNLIDLFKKKYPEAKVYRQVLIDLLNDKILEKFPLIPPKFEA